MSHHLRRRAGLGVAAASLALAATACMPADEVTQTIAFAGSDTTQDFTGALAAEFNADSNHNSDPDHLDNILSQEPTGNAVPGDAECAAMTYRTPPTGSEVLAPNGSSAGRNALKASVQAGDGCIDVARSSSGPRSIGSDLASFRYVAFGLDAVGWSTASSKAPANLTLAQVQGIFDCTYTNWNQVGGSNGPIQRYWPQSGSGTRSFFQSDVLGGADPTAISTPNCPAPRIVQENQGAVTAFVGENEVAIMPYSAANMVAQTRGTQPDQRYGQQVRSLNGQALVVGSGATTQLNLAGPVKESNVKLNNPAPAFPGIRYVFHVLDNTSASYAAANRFVGFVNADEGGRSPLCNGSKAELIADYGFGPLDATVSSRNLAGSTCRQYQP